ncbi:alpha/beta hydrolase [Abyssicoccus albus]|uniref:Enterochelin esterase-like enzyme n=1 Tax=Abyssicoccus albus TaxID=1817405 RepID=A0A1Q1G2H4_9BACL|nr:alpha/beta hydrolase-fold protein [Abyssicoccus albus]AQL56561.1 hypothetical protein BVH56_06360 [Abyssicoccus albus]RPF57628.1 enterochelin esterase-like enzyme [Abyssicoccus albus]
MSFEIQKINDTSFHSEILQDDYDLKIYLPKSYHNMEPHRLIIAFDGQDVFKYAQLNREYEKLVQSNDIEPAIIVGVCYNSVAWRAEHFSPDGIHHQNMLKSIIEELIPYIEQQFNVSTSPMDRIALGDSQAASMALSLILNYPLECYKGIILSPMVTDSLFEWINLNDESLEIFHIIGKEEKHFKLPTTGEMADFLTPNRALNEAIQNKPWTYHYEEVEGSHVWKTWKPHLNEGILYLSEY